MLNKKHFKFLNKTKSLFIFSKKISYLKNINAVKLDLIGLKTPLFCFKTGKNKSYFKSYMLSRHNFSKSVNSNKLGSFYKKC